MTGLFEKQSSEAFQWCMTTHILLNIGMSYNVGKLLNSSLGYTGCLKMMATQYCIIPNRSTGCLDKSPRGCYIRFREAGTTVTNVIYRRNGRSELEGASIRRVPLLGIIRYNNYVCFKSILEKRLGRTQYILWILTGYFFKVRDRNKNKI